MKPKGKCVMHCKSSEERNKRNSSASLLCKAHSLEIYRLFFFTHSKNNLIRRSMSFQRDFKLNEMVAFCQVHIIKNWCREEEKTTNFDDILSFVWYTFNYLDKSSDERYLKYFVICLKELHSTPLSRQSLKPRNNVVLPEIQGFLRTNIVLFLHGTCLPRL